jgi:hypothetical protein
MNIEIIVQKTVKSIDSLNKHMAEIVAMVSSGFVYFNYTTEVIHSIFAILTAVVSYLSVRGTKAIINAVKSKFKKNEKENKHIRKNVQ